ncbi:WYL domain-containing protein [Streptomyces erythrochromogenes]|nr:WYL domain-containing protein [Streptomyces erythrochromogenes]
MPAVRAGADRTYRLPRVRAAEELAEPARRAERVDPDEAWRDRSRRFRTGGEQVTVLVRVDPARREDLAGSASAVLAEETDADGRLRLEVALQDARHAEWALWQRAPSAEVLAPRWLRASPHERAVATTARHAAPSPEQPSPASSGTQDTARRTRHAEGVQGTAHRAGHPARAASARIRGCARKISAFPGLAGVFIRW